MPTPPANPPTHSRTTVGFSAALGQEFGPGTTSYNNGTQPQTSSDLNTLPSLVAVDAVQFNLAGAGSQTVTFPNMPARDNTHNPLSLTMASAQQPFEVAPKDHLLMFVFVSNLVAAAGVTIGVAGQAIDRQNLRVPGPFLGSNVFQTFQAIVTTSGAASGFVCSLLYISVG